MIGRLNRYLAKNGLTLINITPDLLQEVANISSNFSLNVKRGYS